jgi:hypothetical protein
MPRDIPATIPEFRNIVRLFVRDREPYNTLLDGVESTDDMIDLYIGLALSDFNTTPPMIGDYTMQTFPSGWLLLYGTIIELLTSAGILQSRNQLDYNDGGHTVQVSNKTGLYQSWIDRFQRMYQQRKRDMKIQMNMRRGWGGVNSEYAFVSYGAGVYYNYGFLDGIVY